MAINNAGVITTDTILFTCPGTLTTDEREYAITCITFCNNAEQTINLTVHYVPQGLTRSNTNMVIDRLPIPAGETFSFDTEKVVLATGDKIVAIASQSVDVSGKGINATVSSMRVS